MSIDPPSPSTPSETPKSSRRSSRARRDLKLDLSNMPPVVQPVQPSNTIIITKLDNADIFLPENLQNLRDTINQYGAIHTWSPLKSFSRIIIVFYDISVAKLIKETLDGEEIMDCQVRIYFANHTNLSPGAQHLEAPKSDKLFFISPPPSPPHDWESKNEEPPNKTVHAEDLAAALSKLHAKHRPNPDQMEVDEPSSNGRLRSSSFTLVYHPEHHGNHPSLPAISVEDTEFTASPTEEQNGLSNGITREEILNTSRPPVELMEH